MNERKTIAKALFVISAIAGLATIILLFATIWCDGQDVIRKLNHSYLVAYAISIVAVLLWTALND